MTQFARLLLNHNLLITILLFSLPLLPLASPNKTSHLTARLISPLSPESPYYAQILEANNIPSKSKNVPLNRTHYIEWLKTLLLPPTSNNDVGDEKYSIVNFSKISGYLMNMFVGSPPQSVYGLFDTGSELIWLQCGGNPTSSSRFPDFIQYKSLTYKTIPCYNKEMCDSGTSVGIRCGGSNRQSCVFDIDYADNTHVEGAMGTDVALTSLHAGDPMTIADLMFGCTPNDAKRTVVGIIGGGKGKYSFPMQISRSDPKFSYCMSNDMTKTYEIKFGKEAMLMGSSTQVLSSKYLPYYYLEVLGIKVNGKSINVAPYEFEMSPDGSRGFIIDSGSSLSYLTAKVFDAVKTELETLLGKANSYSIYDICYPLSRFIELRYKPTIAIEFPEFEFELPLVGTWELQKGGDEYQCLMIRRTEDTYSILGLVQLWDVNVGHDPLNSKLYLSKTTCSTTD